MVGIVDDGVAVFGEIGNDFFGVKESSSAVGVRIDHDVLHWDSFFFFVLKLSLSYYFFCIGKLFNMY